LFSVIIRFVFSPPRFQTYCARRAAFDDAFCRRDCRSRVRLIRARPQNKITTVLSLSPADSKKSRTQLNTAAFTITFAGRRHVLFALFAVQKRAAGPYLVGRPLGQEVDQGPSIRNEH